MQKPSDLLACEFYSCLYIPDIDCIWKIPTQDDQLPERNSIANCRPWALAMKSGDNPQLIVTTLNDLQVLICDLECNVLSTLLLPRDTNDPQHVIEDPLNADAFILLHRPVSGLGLRHLYRLKRNADNQLVPVDDSFQGNDEVSRPCHLARLEDGRILVADFGNNRMVIAKSDLRGERKVEVLLARNKDSVQGMQVERPCRLAYYPDTGMLIVAMHHDAIVYKITPPAAEVV